MIKLIKKLIERIKMLLDRFIMSSDHDGQKEAEDLDIQFTITSFNLPAQTPYKYQDFTAPKGSYFANVVISDSVTGDRIFYGSQVQFLVGNVWYNVSVYRSGESKYRIWVAHSRKSGVSTATVPTHTVRARLKFYVASKS